MPVIIIPRKRRIGVGRIKVAPEWESQNLVSCFAVSNGAFLDVSSRDIRPVSGTAPSVAPSSRGLAAKFSGSQSMLLSDYLPPYPRTRVALCTPATSAAVIALSGCNGGSTGMEFRLNAGRISLVIAGIQEVLLDTRVLTAGQTYCLGGLMRSGRNEAWIDGRLSASNAVTHSPINSALAVFLGERGNGAERWQGDMQFHADFAGELSREQLAALTGDPRQLFTDDPIRIYSFPSVVSAPSINSITASNITQTGARITLGLTR